MNIDIIFSANEVTKDYLVIVCDGTNGKFSSDHSLCAGETIKRLKYKTLSDSFYSWNYERKVKIN